MHSKKIETKKTNAFRYKLQRILLKSDRIQFLSFFSLLLVLGCGPGGSAPPQSGQAPAAAKAMAVPPDANRKACADGDSAACELAGRPYREKTMSAPLNPDADRALFQGACDRDIAGGCTALAWLLPPDEDARAIAVMARGCALGSGESCYGLGLAHQQGRGVPKDEGRASRLFQEACERGALEACMQSAMMLEGGRGTEANANKAALHYAKACDGKIGDACAGLAVMTALGQGIPKNYGDALRLFEKGCALGSAVACTGLGETHKKGYGVAKNDALAAEFLGKGCQGKHMLACKLLAEHLASAPAPVRDDAQAVRLASESCSESEPSMCTLAGGLVASGRGVKAPDPVLAAKLLGRACDAEHAMGCARLGLLYLRNKGLAQDADKSFALIEKGCTLGLAGACTTLGRAYAHGDGRPLNNARAEALFRRACEKGDSSGCANLGLCYQARKVGGASYDMGIAQAAADCKRSAQACEWLGNVPQAQAELAFKMLVESCDAEIKPACGALARAVSAGRVPANAVKVMTAEIRGRCEQGKAVWCRRIGFWHEQGLSVAQSDASARAFYRRACDGGDARGCGDLGRMMVLGQGGKKDRDGAVGIFRRACDRDDKEGAASCGHLGMVYINEGKAAEHTMGEGLLERACSLGDAQSCDRLGGFLTLGTKGFVKDERRAADLLERACAQGGVACDEARKLREKLGLDDLK